jgi:hypothetical protein
LNHLLGELLLGLPDALNLLLDFLHSGWDGLALGPLRFWWPGERWRHAGGAPRALEVQQQPRLKCWQA